MRKILIVLAALSLCFIAGQAGAGKPMTPESIDGVTIVDSDWVMANLGKIKVYDARKKAEYVEAHIKGAISAPYREKSDKKVNFDASKDRYDITRYPGDKNVPIVVYCNGVRCWKSYKSLVMLSKEGYSNLHWLREGFPGWQKKGYPVE